MIVLAKVKSKTVFVVFWVLLIAAFVMGVYANLPEETQPGQVNIQLYPVKVIQQELVDRGHDIVVDGKFGPETDLALTIELTKENHDDQKRQ